MKYRQIGLTLAFASLLAACAGYSAPNPDYPIDRGKAGSVPAPPPPPPASLLEPTAPAEIPVSTVVPALLNAALTGALTTCATIANRQPVTLLPETQAIAESGGALRQGTLLRVGAAQFVDGASPAGFIRYRYVASYQGLSADLVQVTQGTDIRYLLSDRHTGSQISVSEIPVPSPDGRHFASASVRRFGFSGVEIMEHMAGGWAPRAQLSDVAAPCDLHWTGNDRLSLLIWNQGARREARVIQSGETWTTVIP